MKTKTIKCKGSVSIDYEIELEVDADEYSQVVKELNSGDYTRIKDEIEARWPASLEDFEIDIDDAEIVKKFRKPGLQTQG